MPVPIRAGMLGGARSLPVPLRGRDGGEVVRSFVACGEGRGKRSWLTLAFVFGLGPHSLVGPRSFGLILAGVPWAARAAN